jgi:hypothetical protein
MWHRCVKEIPHHRLMESEAFAQETLRSYCGCTAPSIRRSSWTFARIAGVYGSTAASSKSLLRLGGRHNCFSQEAQDVALAPAVQGISDRRPIQL